MSAVFLDTSYFVAIVDRRDAHHSVARRMTATLTADRERFVTSDIVLIEFLTYFSGYGEHLRRAAAGYAVEIRGGDVEVVGYQSSQFDAALELYRRRGDKSYSMVDCIGMVLCREPGIRDVFTSDGDFEQEGFRALLRETP